METPANMLIREWLNGSLLPLSFSLALIIGIFLFEAWRDFGGGFHWAWTRAPGMKVSCALFWLFSAETIRAGTVWILLRIANDGQRVTELLDFYVNIALILGTLILGGAFVRCNYLFTPERWGHRYWIGSLIVTILFVLLSEVFPPFPLPSR